MTPVRTRLVCGHYLIVPLRPLPAPTSPEDVLTMGEVGHASVALASRGRDGSC